MRFSLYLCLWSYELLIQKLRFHTDKKLLLFLFHLIINVIISNIINSRIYIKKNCQLKFYQLDFKVPAHWYRRTDYFYQFFKSNVIKN